MAKKKIDNETNEVLTEQEKVKKLTEHEGWGLAKSKLLEKIGGLLNISGIDGTSPEQVVRKLAANQLAADILINWIKEVEGTAQQFDGNSNLMKEITENYIVRYDK